MEEKPKAIDHLRPVMNKGTVLFGATILGRGIEPNAAARFLLRLYNGKGVFNNLDDDLGGLTDGLKARFDKVEIETIGCVALSACAESPRFPRLVIAINLPLTIPSLAPQGG